jgi:hypothetical protein
MLTLSPTPIAVTVQGPFRGLILILPVTVITATTLIRGA